MELWVEFLQRIAGATVECLISPFFWVIVALVGIQNRRIAKNSQRFFGIGKANIIKDTLYATLLGVIGGFLGSGLMVLTGVSLGGIGISYLWPLALLLMLISPRFLCFAYSGGIIALISTLFNYPEIQVPQLLALIAILHFVESFLILLSGHLGATPMYTKSKKTNTVVGGFTLQKFWPIPIVVLTILSYGGIDQGAAMQMPEWWPLIKTGTDSNTNLVYAMLPVIAALGYGDLAVARTPVEKSRISARNLSIYSLILLGLALLSRESIIFQAVAALFAPLGHELIIFLGQKMEMRQQPIFTPPSRGIRVLDTVPNSSADIMGLKSGDVIHTVNGIPIDCKDTFEAILMQQPGYMEIEYVAQATNSWFRKTNFLKSGQPFGLIPVPQGNERVYMELNSMGLLQKMWHKFTH